MANDSAVSDLNALIRAAGEVRRPFESQVFVNMAFYVGDQWVAWDGNQLYEPTLENWRAKVVDNRIQPAIRTEIAKLTKSEPSWAGVPRSMSDEDISAARYAEFAMEDAWDRHDLDRKLRAALLWARVATLGYWKITWDAQAGKKVPALVDHETGKVARDAQGGVIKADMHAQMPEEVRNQYAPKDIAMGEIAVDLRNFFEVYVDPHATEEGLISAEWMGEKAVYTRRFIETHFPDEVDRLTFDSKPTSGIGRGRYAMSRFAGSAEANQRQVAGVELAEYWSCDKHVIWSPKSDIVLLEEANPYPWLPYVGFRGTPVPGQFYPDCVATQLVPRQVSLNTFLSQLEENGARIGNPPLLRPSSMDDEEFNWQGMPGEEVVYPDTGSPTAMPSFMQLPEMPVYVQNLPGMVEKSMAEITGQHEVSNASVPAGVTAASAIQLLQEQDDTRLGPDLRELRKALTDAGERVLWLIGNCYTDERHLRVSGEDGWWDVEAFKGTMLRGHTQIRADVGSVGTMSKAAKQAAMTQLLTLFIQNQIPIEPRILRKMVGEFEVGGLEQAFADVGEDVRQVQEENRKMSLGVEVQINAYDNDEAHIAEHESFQKKSRYSRLPDPLKRMFEDHVHAHRDRMASLQAGAMNPGTPDPAVPGGVPLPAMAAPTNGNGTGPSVPSAPPTA